MDFSKRIQENIDVKQDMLKDTGFITSLQDTADILVAAYKAGNKVLLCGNGGSAADAQHIAAELTGRFYLDRPPLDAEALHVNTSYLTAVANDYGYEDVYARLVQARGKQGDILVALSTSGNSPNILRATERAKTAGMTIIGLTGHEGGRLKAVSDYHIAIPSVDTPRIQEAHILVGHLWCEYIEGELF